MAEPVESSASVLTGSDVAALRGAVGLDRSQFAQLLGVNTSTLYRWEAAGPHAVKLAPFQKSLLDVVRLQVAKSKGIGKLLSRSLHVGGGLFGLYRLLHATFAKEVGHG